jgi:hypothetical protein
MTDLLDQVAEAPPHRRNGHAPTTAIPRMSTPQTSGPREPEPSDPVEDRPPALTPGGTPRAAAMSPIPALTLGPPPWTSWREGALTRASELETLHKLLCAADKAAADSPVSASIQKRLKAATEAIKNDNNWRRSFTGATFERINSNCDAIEADLLRIAPDDYLVGQLPSLTRHVKRHLPATDERAQALLAIASDLGRKKEDRQRSWRRPRTAAPRRVNEVERNQIVGAVRAASSAAAREFAAVRSFRNVLIATTALLSLLAVAIAVFGAFQPAAAPLCFTPQLDRVDYLVCPTGTTKLIDGVDIDEAIAKTVGPLDLAVVQLVGLIAASVAAATALQRLRGSTVPFGLPVALAVLKLPTGALTAFAGLVLMRGAFIPGLSNLDSSAQILAWAVIFGYAQQIFTRVVDQQASAVLDQVRGQERRDPTHGAA